MLRVSCQLLIEQCYKCELINDQGKSDFLMYITGREVHVELRNLIMMILLPRKLHKDDKTQSAYLRAAVSRVGTLYLSTHLFCPDRQSNCDGTTRSYILAPYLGDDNRPKTKLVKMPVSPIYGERD